MNDWYASPESLPFKLRFFITEGLNKGDMKREELFPDLDSLQRRYNEEKHQSISPVAFEYQGGGLGWVPLSLS